ncbi:hypothetical protein GGS20DRAFT_95970 [Poronia punctata]|nr:hypothetical protein GGS20DRAFT_95970 [Poronia punctata]
MFGASLHPAQYPYHLLRQSSYVLEVESLVLPSATTGGSAERGRVQKEWWRSSSGIADIHRRYLGRKNCFEGRHGGELQSTDGPGRSKMRQGFLGDSVPLGPGLTVKLILPFSLGPGEWGTTAATMPRGASFLSLRRGHGTVNREKRAQTKDYWQAAIATTRNLAGSYKVPRFHAQESASPRLVKSRPSGSDHESSTKHHVSKHRISTDGSWPRRRAHSLCWHKQRQVTKASKSSYIVVA